MNNGDDEFDNPDEEEDPPPVEDCIERWHLHSPFTPDESLGLSPEWQRFIEFYANLLVRQDRLWSLEEIWMYLASLPIPGLRWSCEPPLSPTVITIDIPIYTNRMAPQILEEASPDAFAANGENLREMLEDVDDDECLRLEHVKIVFVRMKKYMENELN